MGEGELSVYENERNGELQMKVAVCDDNVLIGQQIRDIACQMSEVESCNIYTHGEVLLEDIMKNDRYDVVFMDIQWEGKERGIKWSSQLQKLLPEAKIIYITGYAKEYVEQIFLSPSNLSGVITKPLKPKLLQEHLLKVLVEKKDRNKQKFIFQQQGNLHALYYDEIDYLESIGHKICIYTQLGSFEFYGKIDQIMETFPNCFMQCHKSYLVNMNKVRLLGTQKKLFMESGKVIPVSKARYATTKEKYFKQMKSNMEEKT